MERGTNAYCTYSLSTVCIYGGIVLAAAAAIVARKDCVRKIPLLIVHAIIIAVLFRGISVVPKYQSDTIPRMQ